MIKEKFIWVKILYKIFQFIVNFQKHPVFILCKQMSIKMNNRVQTLKNYFFYAFKTYSKYFRVKILKCNHFLITCSETTLGFVDL